MKAPEDLHVGDYVTVLRAVYDLPSFLWCSETIGQPAEQPIRYQCIPDDSGTPLKVRAVCLPFVHVRHPCGRHETLDVRRHTLGGLNKQYAQEVVRTLQRKRKRRSRKR